MVEPLEEYIVFFTDLHLTDKDIHGFTILIRIRCDRIIQVEHFRALFRNFITIAVRSQTADKCCNFFNVVDIPVGMGSPARRKVEYCS